MNKTDPLHPILGRRSIRIFKPGGIDEPVIHQLLQAAMAAPSAVAKDPWRFVVSRKPEIRSALAAVLSNGEMLNTAALCVTVVADLEAAHDHQLSYALQDCAAAIENLLLAAHELGLGTVWLGIYPRERRVEEIRRLLEIPRNIIPIALVAIGYAAEEKKAEDRFRPERVHRNRWTDAEG